MGDDYIFIVATRWVTNTVTVFFLVKFLHSFYKVPEKTCGLTMIFILTIFSFIFPITDLIKLLMNPDHNVNVFGPEAQGTVDIIAAIEITCYQFTLFWITAFSLFTLLALRCRITQPKHFMIGAIVSCSLATLIFPISIFEKIFGVSASYDEDCVLRVAGDDLEFSEKFIFYMVYDVFGKILPVITTSYCYLQSYKEMKNSALYMGTSTSKNKSRMLWYCAIPIVCFLPGIVTDGVLLSQTPDPNTDDCLWIFVFMDLPARVWGLLNLLSYWFLKPEPSNSRKASEFLIESSLNLNLTGTRDSKSREQ